MGLQPICLATTIVGAPHGLQSLADMVPKTSIWAEHLGEALGFSLQLLQIWFQTTPSSLLPERTMRGQNGLKPILVLASTDKPILEASIYGCSSKTALHIRCSTPRDRQNDCPR